MDILSSWIWPALTALLGFVYTALLVRQYVQRRKMHQLMWAIGFLFYAVAAVMEAWSQSVGSWDATVYRFYIVLAACLVGFLGNGEAYLLFKKRIWGDLYLAFNVIAIGVFLYGTLTVKLDTAALANAGIVIGGTGLGSSGSFPRIMSLFFNIPGSIILLGGAAWSVIKFWPKKAYRYRAWANVLIFAGTLLIAAIGSMARLGSSGMLYVGEMVASALLLWGFLMASTLEKGAKAVVAEHAGHLEPGA